MANVSIKTSTPAKHAPAQKKKKAAEQTIRVVDKVLSKGEFSKLFEKHVRKTIRLADLKKKDTIWCDSPASAYFVEKIHLPCKTATTRKKATVLFLSTTLDDLCAERLHELFDTAKTAKKARSARQTVPRQKRIGLFEHFSDDALAQFCALKKIAYRKKRDALLAPIDALEEKYPGSKHGLVKFLHH